MTELSSRAMLVSLTLRAWKGTATDREIAAQAEEYNKAESGTMRVIKELTPKHYIQPITHIMGIARQEHYSHTVGGLVRGQHLLATAMFDRYIMIQGEIRDQFWRKVEQFLEAYPEIIEQAPKRLHNAYKESDFPTVKQIKTYFGYDLQFSPVPSTGDWRLEGMQSHDVQKLRNEVQDEVRSMFNAATMEVFERAREVLGRIASQARAYKPGPGSGQLRDATIMHLKEMAEIITKMNITDDPELQRVGYEMIENFADCEGEVLRHNEEARLKIAEAAERIMARMPKYGA